MRKEWALPNFYGNIPYAMSTTWYFSAKSWARVYYLRAKLKQFLYLSVYIFLKEGEQNFPLGLETMFDHHGFNLMPKKSLRKTWLRDEASMDLQHHDRYFCNRIQLKYIGNSRDYLILVWHSSPSKVFLYRWRRHACFYYWRGIYVDWVILSFMSADILFTYVPLGKSISCKTNSWIRNNNSPRIIAFKLVWYTEAQE